MRKLFLLFVAVTGAAAGSGAPAEHAAPAKDTTPYEVKWAGGLMAVMVMGDLAPKIQLQDVARIPHLYAIGVLDHLTGEVIVVDGAATLTRIRDKKMIIDHTMTGGSPFLIYVSAPAWKERPIPKDVTGEKALEEFVGKAAQEAGLDVEAPFVFRVLGKVAKARIHVVDLETRAQAHAANDPDAHSKALVPFEITGAPVEMVGFWASKGQSILTHHGTRSHVHLVTADGTRAGHVDGLALDGETVLFLPARAGAGSAAAK
jgi:acetolactate decarboxylase